MFFIEYSSVKSSSKTSIEVESAESFETKQRKTESVTSERTIETVKESSKADEKIEQSAARRVLHEINENVSTKAENKVLESKHDDSISMTLPISRETREKSAEDKLEELDTKLKFVKMIRGTSVERKYICFKMLV